ncbi:MAG: hypothetical protein AAFZ18_02300 [Myxococcota bacterium]
MGERGISVPGGSPHFAFLGLGLAVVSMLWSERAGSTTPGEIEWGFGEAIGSRADFPLQARYVPGTLAQVQLFEAAARELGLPEAWAADNALTLLLRAESDGKVGIPNFTYGERARQPDRWVEIHEELRRGHISASSSATGLGQLILSNVERYYPSGADGIGVPLEEAMGMLSYISARYGDPETAWNQYDQGY